MPGELTCYLTNLLLHGVRWKHPTQDIAYTFSSLRNDRFIGTVKIECDSERPQFKSYLQFAMRKKSFITFQENTYEVCYIERERTLLLKAANGEELLFEPLPIVMSFS